MKKRKENVASEEEEEEAGGLGGRLSEGDSNSGLRASKEAGEPGSSTAPALLQADHNATDEFPPLGLADASLNGRVQPPGISTRYTVHGGSPGEYEAVFTLLF